MTEIPLLTLWRSLLHHLGLQQIDRARFQLEGELVQTVQALAEAEQRPAEEVAAYLMASGLAHLGQDSQAWEDWCTLSAREQQVAALICQNLTNRQIAARLGVTPDTAKTHVRNVLFKFDVHSKGELRLLLQDWEVRGDKLVRRLDA